MKKLIGYCFLLSIILSACSKDRVPAADSYQSLSAFYAANKQPEQVYTIYKDTGVCLITGAQGTKLYNVCDSSEFITTPGGQPISYPYNIGLIELYSVKDIILWQLPDIASGNILETAASIRVRAFNSSSNVYALQSGRQYDAVLNDTMESISPLSVYDGVPLSTYENWVSDPMSTVMPSNKYDSMLVSNLGWVDCARPHISSPPYTSVTFTYAGSGGNNIGIFLVFKNYKSVMQVYNLASGQVPVGEPVTMIAMAINQNSQYVLDERVITVTAGMTIALNMQVISESNLLSALGAL